MYIYYCKYIPKYHTIHLIKSVLDIRISSQGLLCA